MQYGYSDGYYPPMPTLDIQLGYPAEALSMGPITGIVDTGADFTLIPVSLLDQVGAPFSDRARLKSHWGEWRMVSLFTVDMGIGLLRLPAIEVIGDDAGEEIIIGRNVLNRLQVLLDGPGAVVEVME